MEAGPFGVPPLGSEMGGIAGGHWKVVLLLGGLTPGATGEAMEVTAVVVPLPVELVVMALQLGELTPDRGEVGLKQPSLLGVANRRSSLLEVPVVAFPLVASRSLLWSSTLDSVF